MDILIEIINVLPIQSQRFSIIKYKYLPLIKVFQVTALTGNYLGDIIAKLHKHHEANLNRIQITGHSLGAQVAGATGRAVKKILNSKVSRITGLDPARPLFEDIQFRSIGRLTKEDAELVVVVHTDGGGYGYLLSAGHVDFFPNRGVASQPGCLSQDVNGSSEYKKYIS